MLCHLQRFGCSASGRPRAKERCADSREQWTNIADIILPGSHHCRVERSTQARCWILCHELRQISSGGKMTVLQPLTSILRSVVSHISAVVDPNLLSSMLRSEEYESVTHFSIDAAANTSILPGPLRVNPRASSPAAGYSSVLQNDCRPPEFDLDIMRIEVEGEDRVPTCRF